MLLFNAAHHYAKMARLNDHANALRVNSVLNSFRKLYRKSLLYLQAAGKDIDQPGNLAQPQDLAIRDISHMDLAEKRQQMVLAEAKHFNVFNDDHFVVRHVKKRALQDLVGVLLIALGEILQRLLHTLRRSQKAVTVG